jgi:hypothetical protein
MAAQSAVNLIVSELTADLYGPRGDQPFHFAKAYRPPMAEGTGSRTFEYWDSVGDALLAPRIPVLLDPLAPATSLYPTTPSTPLTLFKSGGVNPPLWLETSGYPDLPANLSPQWPEAAIPKLTRVVIHYAPTARSYLGQPLWPCLQVYINGEPWDADPNTPEIDPLPAADADGDGIADSLLFRLPMGPMNGVTYYAAVRVVDNNSAINVNTALSRDFDFDGRLVATTSIPSFFTGRVGLAEVLRSYRGNGDAMDNFGGEFARLNLYRFNNGPQLLAPGGVRGNRNFPHPFDDRGNRRPDFRFLSIADALESQLGRRIGNPGNSIGGGKWKAFSLSDSMALGHRFCLVDPTASKSALELILGESLFYCAQASGGVAAVPTAPYSADDTVRWMDRFRYDLEDVSRPRETFRDLRPLLVARNPTANQAPAPYSHDDVNHDGDRNDLPKAIDRNGDWVAGGAILTDGGDIRPYEGMQPFYVRMPGGDRVRATPPVSINTAAFPELWRGFWSVMTPDYNQYSVEFSPDLYHFVPFQLSPYYGSRFTAPIADTARAAAAGYSTQIEYLPHKTKDNLNPPPAVAPETHPQLMFRSSLRDPRWAPQPYPVRFPPGSQMLLRAALAAVNTEDLRDADDDVTSHLIELRVYPGRMLTSGQFEVEEKVPVRVYGTERQPFLTEVYVNTDDRDQPDGKAGNPKGYVAIELHNPYPVDIPIGGSAPSGWSVGLIDRRGIGEDDGDSDKVAQNNPILAIKNLSTTASAPWRFPLGTVVPAGGYLVLENYNPQSPETGPASASGPFDARYRPDAAALTLGRTGRRADSLVHTVYVPDLHRVVSNSRDPTATGGEFVLLRTRHADCSCTVQDSPDPVNEATNLCDLIPVDQFDFTIRRKARHVDPLKMTGGQKRQAELQERIDELPKEPTSEDKKYFSLHYVRANGPQALWRFVYPGRYNGRRRTLRHQGTVRIDFGPGGIPEKEPPIDEYIKNGLPPVALGAPDPKAHPNQGSFPIQIAAPGFGGPNQPTATGNAYPFGKFGREADLLQVPFIGAYTVYAYRNGAIPRQETDARSAPDPAAGIYEMNSLSMDSVFAEDSDTSDDLSPNAVPNDDDQYEQIGRFCPVQFWKLFYDNTDRVDDFMPQSDARTGASATFPDIVRWVQPAHDPEYDPASPAPVEQERYRYRYRWAMDLFEHFCLHAPHNDFLPNVAPSLYTKANRSQVRPLPEPVSNSGGTPGNSDLDPRTGKFDPSDDYAEDTQPVEGLVNINTAPWKVLAALPMVLNENGTVNVEKNSELAKAIVYFRDVDDGFRRKPKDTNLYPHGPFKSIFELNQVVESRPMSQRLAPYQNSKTYSFRNGYGTVTFAGTTGDPGIEAGDLSPGVPAKSGKTDHVRGDFEENYLVLNRISNLITTRSDSFTCYVYVMGVEDDGTPQARLKVQRRVAFIADRSAVRPLRPVVRTQFFNNE